MKQLHTFVLVGLDESGDPLTPQNCNEEFDRFHCHEMDVLIDLDGDWIVSTSDGSYKLAKHPTINMYTCVAKGCKVQVTMKKMSATVRTWY